VCVCVCVCVCVHMLWKAVKMSGITSSAKYVHILDISNTHHLHS